MNHKKTGEISEAIVLARLIELGYSVSIPFGDNQRYDFIIDRNNELSRIQVKTGRWQNGCVVFATANANPFNGTRTSYVGGADEFAVFCPKTDGLYMIDVKDCPTTECKLRVEQPQQLSTRIRWAKDYLVDRPPAGS